MWLESSQLALSSDKHTLYTAYEVLQADWVLQVSQVQQMFLQANAWVASVIPLGFNQKVSRSKQVDNRSYLGIFLLMVSAPFIDASNFLAYLLQQWYMRQAMTREVVGFSQAFFHPRDTHRDITLRWRNYLESIT